MRFRRGKPEEKDDGAREGIPPVYSYLEGAGYRTRPAPERRPAAEPGPPATEAPPEAETYEPEPELYAEPETYEPQPELLEPAAPVEEAVAVEAPPAPAEAPPPAPAAPARPGKRRLAGYSLPLSASGRSSLVPSPPWHYSGDFLVVEYRVDPTAALSFLPPELEPGTDPGAAAAIFADWQSCSESGEELLDPVRAQYKEFFVVLSASHRGNPVTRCPLMWVDQGFSLARGWLQGFPKKPGSIWMTRPVTVGRAGPRLEEGARFAATCAASDRRLAEATLTLTGLSETGPTVNTPPLVNTRFVPPWDPKGGSLSEHVFAGGRDREISPVWEGEATLRFYESPSDELALLAPLEVGKGFWFSFGYTVDGGKRLT